jgi:glycosyltransferase involved in cell wall biosynthesis
MDKKIISIIVPTYNMENYLKRCLDSVLNHKWDEILEVIVVNDGSEDRSLQIAMEYKDKFPSIVTVIDKENGNYGSTINIALPIVKGKYVKILDADDWFDTMEFERFIEQLQKTDSDMIITHYTRVHISGKKRQIKFHPSEYNVNFNFTIIQSFVKLSNLKMHAVSYRTELLRYINYKQTEGVFYCDMEWVFYPLFFVNKIAFINANVYQYFLGREGQTVDMLISLRNISHRLIVTNNLYSYYFNFDENKLPGSSKKYFQSVLIEKYTNLYKLYLIYKPYQEFNPVEMENFDRFIKEKYGMIYTKIENSVIHKFIPFRFVRYWRKYSKRIPQWILNFLITIKKMRI